MSCNSSPRSTADWRWVSTSDANTPFQGSKWSLQSKAYMSYVPVGPTLRKLNKFRAAPGNLHNFLE